MKKIFTFLACLCIVINLYAENNFFEDMTREHWAYRSVENLVYKGIIESDKNIFDGEELISRYELAFYLSKVLNKLDDEKASADDFLVLENLVYEFSNDLTDFGFNIETYLSKIKNYQEQMEYNRQKAENNEKLIKKLESRLAELEGKYNENNKKLELRKVNNVLKSLNLYYRGSILQKDTDNAKYDEKNYFEIQFFHENFEFMLVTDTEKSEDMTLKLKGNKKITENSVFTFHSKGFEEYSKSFYNNIVYDNLNFDSFDSYGFGFNNDKIYTQIEKESDNVYIISKNKFKYIETFAIANLDIIENTSEKYNYEVVLKYPFKDLFSFSGGYSQILDIENTNLTDFSDDFKKLKIIDSKIFFKINDLNFDIGYENKQDNKEYLYNRFSINTTFDIYKELKAVYRSEYLNVNELSNYFNHYILIQNKSENYTTYLGFNIIDFDGDIYNYKRKTDIEIYEKEQEKTEYFIKLKTDYLEFFVIDIGYFSRTYWNTSNNKEVTEDIVTTKVEFELNEEVTLFAKYIKCGFSNFNDRKTDINDNFYNLDWDNETGIIENSQGIIEFGIELII